MPFVMAHCLEWRTPSMGKPNRNYYRAKPHAEAAALRYAGFGCTIQLYEVTTTTATLFMDEGEPACLERSAS